MVEMKAAYGNSVDDAIGSSTSSATFGDQYSYQEVSSASKVARSAG